MGYSRNPAVLRQFLAVHPLEELKLGLPAAFATAKGDAPKFAYALRQALAIAKDNPDEWPELAVAAARYRVVIPSDDRVEAEPVASRSALVARPADVRIGGPRSVTHGGDEPFGQPTAHIGLGTAEAIITSWKARQPSNDPIVFKNVNLPTGEMLRLWKFFTQEIKPKWMLLDAPNILTIAPLTDDMKELAWSPPPLPAPEESLNL